MNKNLEASAEHYINYQTLGEAIKMLTAIRDGPGGDPGMPLLTIDVYGMPVVTPGTAVYPIDAQIVGQTMAGGRWVVVVGSRRGIGKFATHPNNITFEEKNESV